MSEVIVETRDLSIRFGGVLAVNNVNFSLRAREMRCLIGPNGAGKSTFFKCLTVQHKINSSNGYVFIDGHDVTGWQPYEIVQLGVGIKTQVPSVMNGLTVWENLWLSARRIHGKQGASAEVDRVITELGLQSHLRRVVGELAHGQRQIVEIGLVLCQRPKLVLLDEPAAGITGAEADRLVELIKGINHFVRMLGGAVTVLHQGAILVEGEADAVMSNEKVREVYIGNRAK